MLGGGRRRLLVSGRGILGHLGFWLGNRTSYWSRRVLSNPLEGVLLVP